MNEYKNVECKRCGQRWYSEEFDENGELPDECVYCYRNSVRKIPDPPTKLDKFMEWAGQKRREIPEKAAEKKHQMILWKENNKLLLSMAATGLIMLGITSVLVYFLFLA